MILVMLSQQDQEMRRNVPDPSFAGGTHFCGSGAGNETIYYNHAQQVGTISFHEICRFLKAKKLFVRANSSEPLGAPFVQTISKRNRAR